MLKPMKLHDWNDARLILATAKLGSFVKAATSLGLDQKTASRRIKLIEETIGRPIFHRRKTGAVATEAGSALVAAAEKIAEAVFGFESIMRATSVAHSPTVTLSASEGIQSYLLIPALLRTHGTIFPLDSSRLPTSLPVLSFTTYGSPADITVAAINPTEAPPGGSAFHIRRIGQMRFKLVASQKFPLRDIRVDSFDDIDTLPLIDMTMYRDLKNLAPWNNLISERETRPVLVASNTSAMQRPVSSGAGITIFPDYAPMFDDSLITLDVPTPSMAVDLWLIAHEDSLREPSVRQLYDGIAEMFVHSPWF